MASDKEIEKEEKNEEQEDGSLNKSLLDQEEIESLIGTDVGVNDHEGFKALIQSTAVSYERLPMLEVIFDRLVRLLSTSLRNFTSDNVEVSLLDMYSLRFHDYLDSIKNPSLIDVIKLKEWDSTALLLINNDLVFTLVDVLLGGRREQTEEPERPYTSIERTLMEDFSRVILEDLTRSFEPIEKVTFEFDRMETNPRFAMIERPGNAGIVVQLKIEMDDRGGKIEFFIPYSSIEGIRDKLLQMFVGEKLGHDKIWENHLAHEVWSTNIETDVILDQLNVNLSDVMRWKKGSFLPLETYEGANVIIKKDDCLLFSGKVGNVRKKVAIQIEENYLKKDKKK